MNAAQRNKVRTLELIDRVMNSHDTTALLEFTSNPAVIASAEGLLNAFPDLQVTVRWIVSEDDMTVVFHDVHGTQQGPWLFVQEPTGRKVETSFMLGFQFSADGQITDQWLGSNFIQMLTQLGWGFTPRTDH